MAIITKGNFNKTIKAAMECISLAMAMSMRANLKMMRFTGKAGTGGKTGVLGLKVSSRVEN